MTRFNSNLQELEPENWAAEGLNPYYEPLEPGQQQKLNRFAISVGETIGLKSSLDTNNWGRMNPGLDTARVSTLAALWRMRFIFEPKLLPYLIDGLGHTNFHAAEGCQGLLVAMTGRMNFRELPSREWHRDVNERQRLIEWWWQWYAINKDKHPLMDQGLQNAIGHEITNVLSRIATLRGKYPELAVFHPLPYHGIPYIVDASSGWNSAPIQNLDRNARVQFACTFKTPPYAPLRSPGKSVDRAAFPWARKLTPVIVYRRELEGTDICTQVQVWTEKAGFVEDLRKALGEN